MDIFQQPVRPPVATESKFQPPALPSGMHKGGSQVLADGQVLAHRLVYLCAPAGYGKTTRMTRLGALAGACGRRSVWLRLGPEDNSAAGFGAALWRALGVQERAEQVRESAAGAPFGALRALCAACAEAGPLVLFLDDYQRIDQQAVHDMLDWLIRNLAPQITLVVASRLRLPLALGTLRLGQHSHAIGPAELALSASEAASLLHALGGSHLGAAESALLHQRTEGWAAGLEMAAGVVRQSGQLRHDVEQFSGLDSTVAAYLDETVLAGLSPTLRGFMEESALFERFSVPFCQQVLGQSGALALLDELHEKQLFTVALDRNGQWHRYHHLLAGHLQNRCLLARPERARALYRAASAWFEQQKNSDQALRYALAGAQPERAAALLERCAYPIAMFNDGHHALLDWCAHLPTELLATNWSTRMARIWSLMMVQRHDAAGSALRALKADLADLACMAAVPAFVARNTAMLDCVLAALGERHAEAARLGQAWLARWEYKAEPLALATVQLHAAGTSLANCQYPAAARSLGLATGRFQRHASAWGETLALTVATTLHLEQGKARQAGELLASACQRMLASQGPASRNAAMLRMLQAGVCYEQDDLASAERLLDEAFGMVDACPFGEHSVAAFLTRSRILFGQGRHEAADACLADALALAQRLDLAASAAQFHAERVHQCIKAGALERARYLEAGFHPPAAEAGTNIDFVLRASSARLAAADGDTAPALARMSELLASARQRKAQRWTIKLLAMKAGVLARSGGRDEALRLTAEALTLADAGGMRRSLLDEASVVGELLAELAARQAQQPLPAASPGLPAGAPAGAARHALSKRELQILGLLTRGLRNREVAGHLFLTETTVKWHLSNIYAKLNVNNRTGALDQARRLALL